MHSLVKTFFVSLFLILTSAANANTLNPQVDENSLEQPASNQQAVNDQTVATKVENLKEPMYNPFIERYLVDEVKSLRNEIHQLELSLTKQVVDRDLRTVDRVTAYATDTVTYLFYLIAGVSSVLVMLGWNSIRDIKDKVHDLADTKVTQIVSTYEDRLDKMEKNLNRKTAGIKHAQEQLEQHQDIHTLWLKAAQENLLSNKIAIYDQILDIDPTNPEALTYKADAALDLDEPVWAINLCHKALKIDPNNAHAYYQLAGAHAQLGQTTDALSFLERNIQLSDSSSYDEIKGDKAFASLIGLPEFEKLMEEYQKTKTS